MNEKDIAELKTNVAVILATCKNIEGDVGEIKETAKNHEGRIRGLELRQERMETQVKQQGILAIAIASVSGFLTGIFSK